MRLHLHFNKLKCDLSNFFYIILSVLVCYVWVVQYSLYKVIKSQNSQNMPTMPGRSIAPPNIRSYEPSRRYYAETSMFSHEARAPAYIDVFEPEPIFYMPEPDPDPGYSHDLNPPDYDLQMHLDAAKKQTEYCDLTRPFRMETCIRSPMVHNECQASCESLSQSRETISQSNETNSQCYEPD